MTHWIITSSLLIGAVLLIRILGRDRLSARLRYALWALVLLRLLMPFSLGESVLSLQNYLPEDTASVQTFETYEPSETIQTGGTIQMPQTQQTPVQSGEKSYYVNWPMLIWAVGAVLVGGVFLVSNLRFGARLRRSRKEVMHRFVPIYECAAVETPCLFGFLRPAVYITPEVMADEPTLRHVLAHELTHYRHLDHIWSMLRCVCVTLHWYNPLVWVAAYVSQQDAELACDEGTLRRLGEHERTAYAKTLLDLSCVGYRGLLTTATSMTGSEGDLKARVLRIVKNPKMPVAVGVAVLIVAAVAAAAVFTGAVSSNIEGVWRMEMSYLGGDTEGPASAYMEYEFYDTRGVRTMIVGDEIRSAEWFIYSENPANGLLELSMLDTEEVEVETFAWEVTEDTLTLVQDRRELVLTRVEREAPPYLPEGVRDIYNLRQVPADDDTVLEAELNGTEQAQLLHLLRSGTVAETRKEVASNQGHPMYKFTVNTRSGYTHLSVAGGLVYDTDKNTGYVVSNIDEIVAWLEAREWRDARAYSVYGISVEPEPVEGAVNIAWGLPSRSNYMVPADQTAWREAVDAAKAKGVPDGADMTIIERMEFGLYADGQHWYFDTDGTAYIAGAELYIAPEGTDTIMQLLQPYVDIVSPDTGDTLPYAGTTHYILWEGRDGNVLKFVDGDFMQQMGDLLRAGAEELPDAQRGIEWREGCYKLFGNRLGIDGYEIMISDLGELVIDWDTHYTLSNADEVLRCANGIMNGTANLTPDEQLEKKLAEELHFSEGYPITVELLAKTQVNGRSFALAGVQNDVYEDYLVEYTETLDHYSVLSWAAAVAAPPEISGYWPNYAVMGGTNLCWSVIPTERMATTPDGKAVDMSAKSFAVNDYTAIRFRMANGTTIDTPISKGTGTRLMLQMFDGEWPVSSVPMVGKTEVTICEMTFDYATTGYPAGSLGEVIDESDLEAAVQLAKADYETWKDEEWCLSMEVLDAAVNEAESERLRAMYENFEEGWSREYLAENFVVVRVTYKCELDHNKIFYPDGTIEKDTILVRDHAAADWEIRDYSAEISVDPPDGRGESEVE